MINKKNTGIANVMINDLSVITSIMFKLYKN